MDGLVTTAGAMVFAILATGAIAFQVALALGAPWGAYAMGETFPERFPRPLRVAALGQAGLLAALALIVLADAGLVAPSLVADLPWLIWLPVGFSAVSLVLNAASRSGAERRVWVPVALGMLTSSLAVAL